MQWIEASLAAIIASTMPLLVALIGWSIYGERVPFFGVIGLIAGLIGVSLIMGSRITGGADPMGLVFCIIGALALAFATLSVRGASSGGNLFVVIGLQMWVGGGCLLVVAAFTETLGVTFTTPLVVAFLYTTLAPGLLATWIWFILVARIGAVKASTYHFLNPVFGVSIAAVLLSEAVRPIDLIGVVIVAAGILAVQLSNQT